MDHGALLAPSLPISECLVWVEITERCSLWGPSQAFPAPLTLSRQPEMSLQHCPGGRSLCLRARVQAVLVYCNKSSKVHKVLKPPPTPDVWPWLSRVRPHASGDAPLWQQASSLERASGDLVPRSWQAFARMGVVHHPPPSSELPCLVTLACVPADGGRPHAV